MQVFLQIVAFSLQIIGSVPPVLTKGKRPKYFILSNARQFFTQTPGSQWVN